MDSTHNKLQELLLARGRHWSNLVSLQSGTLCSPYVAMTHLDETSLNKASVPPLPCHQDQHCWLDSPSRPSSLLQLSCVLTQIQGFYLILTSQDHTIPGNLGWFCGNSPCYHFQPSGHLTPPSVAHHQIQKLHLASLCLFVKPAQGREDGSVHKHLPCKQEDLEKKKEDLNLVPRI